MPFKDEQEKGADSETIGKVPGRILALDLGTRRVGVAVCDELRLTVRALPLIPRTSWKRLLVAVSELCEEFDAKMLVIGLPLRLDGTEGDAAAESRRLARNFGLSLGIRFTCRTSVSLPWRPSPNCARRVTRGGNQRPPGRRSGGHHSTRLPFPDNRR